MADGSSPQVGVQYRTAELLISTADEALMESKSLDRAHGDFYLHIFVDEHLILIDLSLAQILLESPLAPSPLRDLGMVAYIP